MAAQEMQAKLGLDGKDFDAGVKSAKERIQELSEQFGVGETKLQSLKKSARSAKKDFQDLSMTYAGLSDELKNSDFGRALAKEIEAARTRAGELTDMMGDLNKEISNVANDTRVWSSARDSIDLFANGIELASSLIGTFTDDEQTSLKMMNAVNAARATANTLIGIGNALQKQSNVMMTIDAIKKWASAKATTAKATAEKVSSIATKASNAETKKEIVLDGKEKIAALATAGAKGVETTATKGATIAQKAFNLVANANPYVLLATAVIGVGTALYGFISATSKSAEEEKKAKEEADKLKKKQEEQQHQAETLGGKTADLTAKYRELQIQWSKLQTVGEKKKFIEENKSAFEQLGFSVTTLNDAYKVLVKNAPQVVAALKSMAEAEAYKDLYEEAVKKRAVEWDNRQKSTKTGDFYTKLGKFDRISDEEARAAGVRTNNERVYINELGMGDYEAHTQEEIDKVNTYRNKKALESNAKQKKIYDDEVSYYENLMSKTQQTLMENERRLASLQIKRTSSSGGSSSSSNTESPLSKVNSALTQADNQLAAVRQDETLTAKEKLDKEKKITDDKIKAISDYIDTLEKTGKVTKADKKKLEELKPVLAQLKNEAKNLETRTSDLKVVDDAEEAYKKTLTKLDREKEEGLLTDEQYQNKVQSALQSYIESLNNVTDLNGDVKAIIKKLVSQSKAIEKANLDNEFKKATYEVSDLIASIRGTFGNKSGNGKWSAIPNANFNRNRGFNDRYYIIQKLNNPNYKGDRSNWNLNATSYHKLNANTQGMMPSGRVNAVDQLSGELDKLLDAYQKIETATNQVMNSDNWVKYSKDQKDAFKKNIEGELGLLEDETEKVREKLKDQLTFEVNIENIQNTVDNINQVADAMGSFGNYVESLAKIRDTWKDINESDENGAVKAMEKFATVISIVTGALQTFSTIMTTVNTLQGIFAAKEAATAVATTEASVAQGVAATESAASIPTKVAETAANKTLEASLLSLAAAEYFAAHASIPFVGLGLATGFATSMFGLMAGYTATAAGIAALANGGIVPGSQFHGDHVNAALNSGEMVLNNGQQANLFKLLDGSGIFGMEGVNNVRFRIEGKDLVGVFSNYNKVRSKRL